MKQFKVVFIKIQKVIPQQNSPVLLAEQLFTTESDKVDIPVPFGFQIMSVTELLPDKFLKDGTNIGKA